MLIKLHVQINYNKTFTFLGCAKTQKKCKSINFIETYNNTTLYKKAIY